MVKSHTWRSSVRSAIRATSQLLVGGPLMWMLPMYLHVYQKSIEDDDDEINKCRFLKMID